MDRHLYVSGKIRKSICITPLLLFIFFLLPACEKEKATAPEGQGPVGTCEILDKLPQEVTKPLEINFGNRIKLTGITVDKKAEDMLQVSYYWKLIEPLEAYNTVFVHFTDKDNKGMFQNDHPFCSGKSFAELKDRIIRDAQDVYFPKTAAGREITVKIGLYDPKFSGRLKIESSGGIPSDDDNTRAIVTSFKL